MSGRSLTLGQYYPVDSAMHLMDPRIKIILVMSLVAAIFLIDRIAVLLALAALVPLMAAMSKLPFFWVARSLRPLAVILAFTFLVHLLFSPGRELFAIGPLAITDIGLERGAFFTLRLVLVVLVSSFVTLTTTPVRLTGALESLLRPLKSMRLPVAEFALMMTIAIRFIPTLLEEAEMIMKAQKARGADFESGNVIKRARSFIPLLIPLFVGAFRRADELALAMEARGYAGGRPRTRMNEFKLRKADIAILILGLGFVAILMVTSVWAGTGS